MNSLNLPCLRTAPNQPSRPHVIPDPGIRRPPTLSGPSRARHTATLAGLQLGERPGAVVEHKQGLDEVVQRQQRRFRRQAAAQQVLAQGAHVWAGVHQGEAESGRQ